MILYELNVRSWLSELSQQHGRSITLATVPDEELKNWVSLGFTHIWLMGVWNIGPRTVSFSRRVPELRKTAAVSLPDFSEADIVGSPYAVAGYQVAETLGGESGLKAFREQLNRNGLKLILDFIPNHTGLDHPWLDKRPELFMTSRTSRPETFPLASSNTSRWVAHGKDPYFPAWSDTAQLDYRNPATRKAMTEELQKVADLCDGVRCDMAMLVLEKVFARTWARFPSEFASRDHSVEFWAEAVSRVKASYPEFLFFAEAYWDLEPHLLELGFDFAYDKRLTDHLLARRSSEVQQHLLSQAANPKIYGRLSRYAHFLENHDEPRAASILNQDEHRAAALLILALPGLRFLHQGQLTGARIRASVHLRRRPFEPPLKEIAAFYELFLKTLENTAVGHGIGDLLSPMPAWENNPTWQNLIIVQWHSGVKSFDLVTINLAPHRSQAYVRLAIPGLDQHDWLMTDLLGDEQHERKGATLGKCGLYLDLPSHAAQLFHFSQIHQ